MLSYRRMGKSTHIWQLRAQQHGRRVRPAPRHVAHGVAPPPQHQLPTNDESLSDQKSVAVFDKDKVAGSDAEIKRQLGGGVLHKYALLVGPASSGAVLD